MHQLLRFAALALGLTTVSCQMLADIETRKADPLASGCTLPPFSPNDGSGKVRLINLLPSDTHIDVCFRTSGAASYGRPILRSSGRDINNICGAGLAYTEATIPFAITAGKTDVKIIESGKTCTAPALTEKIGVDVGTDLVVTLAYMGGGEVPPTLFAMPEAPPPDVQQNRKNRLVNAVVGAAIEFGLGVGDKLPTTINQGSKFNTKALEFGQFPSTDEHGSLAFTYDKYGYFSIIGQPLTVVGVQRGSDKALFLMPIDGVGNVTLYAIGELDGKYPLQGLFCRDNVPNDTSDAKADCKPSELESFSIDVFNAGLYGAFAAVEAERALPVLNALAQRGAGTDMMCVSEITRHEGTDLPDVQKEWTQEKLIQLAQDVPNGFRYFAQAKTDLDSAITDPVNQKGETPTPQGRPACDAAVPQEMVEAAYSCLSTNCSDTGNESGVTAGGTRCYSAKCAGALSGLLYGDTLEKKQCFNCMILNGLSYKTWAKNKQICSTDTRRMYGFDGQTSSILLSRFPLLDIDQYVLSSTVFRRTAVYAKLQYEANKTVDVYCVHAPPLLGAQVAYTGEYANDAKVEDGSAWYEEQTWGIRNFVEWVKKKSEGRPAIIMGDFSSSKKALDKDGMVIVDKDGLPLVADVNPATLSIMQTDFTEAYPASTAQSPYLPQCTRCPSVRSSGLSNPYNTGFVDPQWTLRVYMKNKWYDNPAVSAGLFYTELNNVMINDTTFGLFGPYSDTFGYNVRIRRP